MPNEIPGLTKNDSFANPVTFLHPNGFAQTFLLFALTIEAHSGLLLPARGSRSQHR